MALQPGTHLGVYDVTAQIGEGGMGTVYRAHDTKLNRDVALKVLPDSVASHPDRHGADLRLRDALEPLFVKYSVSVVLNGHDHFYERVKPQRGIAYFVVGSAGQLRVGNIDRASGITAKGFDTDQVFMAAEIVGDEMYSTPSRASVWGYRTRVITDGVEPSLHIEYKSSRVKRYFKEQRALRTETTINNPNDCCVNKAVPNLSHLRDLGHQVNRRLLEVERVSHQCVLTQDALDRLQQPTLEAGQRTPALRFGDPRVMALCQAITGFPHLPQGFRNRDLRPHVEALLGRPYSTAQMTYDLRRLRLK